MHQSYREDYGGQFRHWKCEEIMTRMFHWGRSIYVKYGHRIFTEFFPSHFPLYWIHLLLFLQTQGIIYGTKNDLHEIPGTTMTKENGHMGKLEYQFRFPSFKRRPPRKMTSTIILGLAYYFWGVSFTRAICQSYTKTVIFKMLAFLIMVKNLSSVKEGDVKNLRDSNIYRGQDNLRSAHLL